ncbi:hypothetical protein HDU80_010056, partial [Chytriomyces hyalinus]
MNNEELHAMVTDFRRLRSEMLDRSNQILSLFETALKRSAVVQSSNEQFSYLDYGIRITEGDYMLNADRSSPPSEVALFSEGEKRQIARSVGVSHAADLNDRGVTANVSHSDSNKMWEPLKRSLTATQKIFVRSASVLSRKKTATGGAHDQEQLNSKQPDTADSGLSSEQAYQKFQVPELSKHLFVNALGGGVKPQLSIVTEGNSSLNSFDSTNQSIACTSLDRLAEPQIAKKLAQNLAGQESTHAALESYPASANVPKQMNKNLIGQQSLRNSSASRKSSPDIIHPISVAIQFNDLIVQRFSNSNMSSLAANASQDSVADSIAVTNSLLSTPKSDVRRQSSFRRSLSRKRVSSTMHQTPTQSMPKIGPEDSMKKVTQFSLVTSGIQSKRSSHKMEDPKIQAPSFPAYLFLFPAYDYKGRRVSVESLAAFGKINPTFHVNGIHPRSMFSNIWDLTLGVVMFALMWLIPFVAAYNPTYQICDINILAITISVVFLCDSIVSLITPQLVSGDPSLDLTEYEKARPTLPVCEMLDRSNQILSLFETALKRSAVVQSSNEQFSYLDYGIRITEGDYMLNADRSSPPSEVALFSEGEKRQIARSVGVSHAADLNDRGVTANVSHSDSNKMWEPLKRSLTATQKIFVRSASVLSRKKTATGGAHDQEQLNSKQPDTADSGLSSEQAYQKFQVPELSKHLFVNALGGGVKPQLSIVTEGNSSLNSFDSTNQSIACTSLDRLAEPQIAKKLAQNLAGQESTHAALESYPASANVPKQMNKNLIGQQSLRNSSASRKSSPDIIHPISVAIQFNDLVVQRFINSNVSSLDANASQDSVADSIAVTNSLLSTPKSDLRRQSSFRRSLSRKRVSSTMHQTPTQSMPKIGPEDSMKKVTQFSLVTTGIHSKSPSHKMEDAKIQAPSFLAYFFLFPAYDYKGRRVTVESLAAFGKINPVFHVNGIHPRSMFANIWDLSLG